MPIKKEGVTRLNDEHLALEMFKLFDQGISAKSEVEAELRKKHAIGNNRYSEKFEIIREEWANQRKSAYLSALDTTTKKEVLKGLKTGLERQMMLQEMLNPDYMHETATYDTKLGKVVRYYRRLTPSEIFALHTVLNRMDGTDKSSTNNINLNGLQQIIIKKK